MNKRTLSVKLTKTALREFWHWVMNGPCELSLECNESYPILTVGFVVFIWEPKNQYSERDYKLNSIMFIWAD